jgi:inner membrane transporter RhtA
VALGFQGLAVSMSIAAIATLPISLGSAHFFVGRPYLFGRMLLVAITWTALGLGAKLQPQRRLKLSIVSVLLALDPAVACGVGWLLLGQAITTWDLVGLVCVVLAGVAVTYDAARAELKSAQ